MIDPDAVAARSAAGAAGVDAGASNETGGPGAPAADALAGATVPGGESAATTRSLPLSDEPLSPPRGATAGPAPTQVVSPEVTQGSYGEAVELPLSGTGSGSAEHAPGGSGDADTGPSHPEGKGPHLSLHVPFSFEAGPLPGIEYGVGAGVGIHLGSFLVEASITDWLRSAVATVAVPKGAGGTFRMVSGTLDACYRARVDFLDLGPCAEFEAGQIEATGLGVSHTSTAYVPWVAAGGGAFAAANLGGGWALPLQLEALVPLARRDYAIQNVPSVVYRPSAVGGRLSMGLEVRF
jgi:hypothetical protein